MYHKVSLNCRRSLLGKLNLPTRDGKACFKCIECKKPVEAGNVRDKETQIYCGPCHGKLFGPKVISLVYDFMVGVRVWKWWKFLECGCTYFVHPAGLEKIKNVFLSLSLMYFIYFY